MIRRDLRRAGALRPSDFAVDLPLLLVRRSSALLEGLALLGTTGMALRIAV